MAADADWQDFYEFQEPARSLQDRENCNASPEAGAGPGGAGDSFPALACSLEEKLSLCFRPSGPGAEPPRAAVRPITERSLLQGDEIWNALTDNYGNVMPVDWKSSHTRTLHLLTLNLSEKGVSDSLLFDTSDEEELREQLDMHSIIVSCVNDEPLFTADQVIEEIEEMMQESPDPEDDETLTQSDRLSMLSQEIQTLKRSSTSSYEERVRRLPAAELNELLEDIEAATREFSEELVQQLALRDELEFEKEVKNSFISALIEVQNKQKEHRDSAKKKKKLRNGAQPGRSEGGHAPGTRLSMEGISHVIQNGLRHTFGNSGGEKQYLTTIIPYEKKNGPPSVEDLQILTKILRAMKEDSERVPSLLTDYILKGRTGWKSSEGSDESGDSVTQENGGEWNSQRCSGAREGDDVGRFQHQFPPILETHHQPIPLPRGPVVGHLPGEGCCSMESLPSLSLVAFLFLFYQ